jgi:integrase
VDLFNPENFLEKMPMQTDWTPIRKYNLAKVYKSFLNKNKIKATLPKYPITRPLPYIPLEQLLDKLIASCNGQMSIFLQTLNETAARHGEALRIEWNDLDIEGKKLRISQPEKGYNPRLCRSQPTCLTCYCLCPANQSSSSTTNPKTTPAKPSGKCVHAP